MCDFECNFQTLAQLRITCCINPHDRMIFTSLIGLGTRARRSLKLPIPTSLRIQDIEIESDPIPNKILLLYKELRLNTGCLRVAFFFESNAKAFRLRTMPKLIILVYSSKKYVCIWRVASVLIRLADCFLLHHEQIFVWMPFPTRTLLREKSHTNFLPFQLDLSWFR